MSAKATANSKSKTASDGRASDAGVDPALPLPTMKELYDLYQVPGCVPPNAFLKE